MQFERCNHCRRPYQVNTFDFQDMDWASTAETLCPHCGHRESRNGDNIFIVHAMTPEEEAAFDATYPPDGRDDGIIDRD